MSKHLTLSLLTLCSLLTLAPQSALAQQQPAAAEADIFAPLTEPLPAVSDPAAAQTPTQKAGKKTKLATQTQKPALPAPTGGTDLEQRLQLLEEQISDMQVSVGTMESLGRGRNGTAAPMAQPMPNGGETDIRVGRMESQLQGLNAQMAELANQLRALEAKLQGSGAQQPTARPVAPKQSGALTTVPNKQSALTGMLSEQSAAADTGFGQTYVQQDSTARDLPPADQAMAFDAPAATLPAVAAQARIRPIAPAAASAPNAPPLIAALAPPANDPQSAYDVAYGLILQQDYAGAEGAFHDYLDRFPQSPLASNAHYWYGQSFYARGEYKPAADAFLHGYKAYRTGQKAPDSLLKVGMALSRLGQKDMACSALTALDGEFPNAPVQVKHLAQTERERDGC